MGIVPRSDQHRHCGDGRINGLASVHEAEMAKHDRIRTDATLGTPRIPVELWGRDCIEVVAKRNARHGYLVPKSGRPPVQLADRVVGDRDDAVRVLGHVLHEAPTQLPGLRKEIWNGKVVERRDDCRGGGSPAEESWKEADCTIQGIRAGLILDMRNIPRLPDCQAGQRKQDAPVPTVNHALHA